MLVYTGKHVHVLTLLGICLFPSLYNLYTWENKRFVLSCLVMSLRCKLPWLGDLTFTQTTNFRLNKKWKSLQTSISSFMKMARPGVDYIPMLSNTITITYKFYNYWLHYDYTNFQSNQLQLPLHCNHDYIIITFVYILVSALIWHTSSPYQ